MVSFVRKDRYICCTCNLLRVTIETSDNNRRDCAVRDQFKKCLICDRAAGKVEKMNKKTFSDSTSGTPVRRHAHKRVLVPT